VKIASGTAEITLIPLEKPSFKILREGSDVPDKMFRDTGGII